MDETAAGDDLEQHRLLLRTPAGTVSVLDVGEGQPALLVHGVGTNALLWRHVIAGVAGPQRRCVAVDLPLHGRSPLAPGQPLGLPALAGLLEAVCARLGVDRVDLVGNDTGGAVAQVFAAAHPDRVRTLVLTNCEVHDNLPPRAFAPTVLLARLGLLAVLAPALVRSPAFVRRGVFGSTYKHPDAVPAGVLRGFVDPVVGTRARAREFQRWLTALRAEDLLAAEPGLRTLPAPALCVWGTDDVFFDVRWAHHLTRLLPNTRPVVEIADGRLFFPDERAAELVPHLLAHWAAG